MAKVVISKRVQISRDVATQVAVIAVAAFITMFSLIASKTLISQKSYQSRVIAKKEIAKKQLNDNIASVNSLVQKYKTFESSPENILGGDPKGTGILDGDNARLVLDALPSKYDFPALTSSIEKLLTGYEKELITGNDDSLAQASQTDITTPVPMPISLGYVIQPPDYQHGIDFITDLERSIRPISVTKLGVHADQSGIHFAVDASSYYLPTKSLDIKKELVR
ncbi:MAG TPA: hypothetical protein VLF39_03575 [Candidatus Saccharimonadales bacterium]|nr:hypothetical protein [Candidatus Saccharimonadales bacterium]